MIYDLIVKFSASPIVSKLDIRAKSFGTKDLQARYFAHKFAEEFVRANVVVENDISKPPIASPTPSTVPSIAFIYWAQGFESAPSIVRACLLRLHKLNPSMQIVELDDRNLEDWVSIPTYILENRNISKTHFSDILRVSLLARYGGVWIDATCYCSRPLDSLIEKVGESFFAYTRVDHSMLSSWFLISQSNNVIPLLMRDAFYFYYKNNSRVPHYFFFHYLFEAFYHAIPSFRNEWDRRLVESSDSAHVLQGLLSKPYRTNIFAEVLQTTHVQKLSYKLTVAPGHDSFYFYVCEMELPNEDVRFVRFRDRSRLLRRVKRLFVVAVVVVILYFLAIF